MFAKSAGFRLLRAMAAVCVLAAVVYVPWLVLGVPWVLFLVAVGLVHSARRGRLSR